jgi:hypothetical protein
MGRGGKDKGMKWKKETNRGMTIKRTEYGRKVGRIQGIKEWKKEGEGRTYEGNHPR